MNTGNVNTHPWNGDRLELEVMVQMVIVCIVHRKKENESHDCACYMHTVGRDMRLKKEGQREGERWRKGVGSV